MDKKPLLVMIGADKGGVGKTTFARLLLNYLENEKLKYRAVDSEAPLGVLQRFAPDKTEVLDITQSSNQMLVFDKMTPQVITVVDVRAGLLSPTLKTMVDVGLLDMVKNGDINLAVMHVLGPTLASLREIKETASIITGASHYLIKNHINRTKFFEWDKAAYDAAFTDLKSGLIDIPNLDELATEHVEVSGVSYNTFINDAEKYSMVMRGYVRNWLKNAYSEMNKGTLPDLLRSGSE